METTEQVVVAWIEQWRDNQRGGPYIIEANASLIGCTGFEKQDANIVSTGYVLAREYWGKGFATEALSAIVDIAIAAGTQRLYAYCHHEHSGSARVLEKCKFTFEGRLRNFIEFPNYSPGELSDVLMYSWIPDAV